MIDRESDSRQRSPARSSFDRHAGWRMPANRNTRIAIGFSVIAAAAALALIPLQDTLFPRTGEPQAVVAGKQRLGTNSAMFSLEGRDRAGRIGVFDVVVLDRDILWASKSADDLEKNGVLLAPGETVDTVLEQELRDTLTQAQDIIAVGTAMPDGDPDEEALRAGRRAVKTAEIVSSVVAAWVPLWSLNLGQYREPCSECETEGTTWERPFVVIGVRSLEPDTNLKEALRDAMSGKSNLPGPTAYSDFTLTRLR
jgi:hypothetical protein